MKRTLRYFGWCWLLAALTLTSASARMFGAVDPNRTADVNNKVIDANSLDLKTLSQPTRSIGAAPLSKGDLKMKGAVTKGVEFKSLDYSSVPVNTLPQQNFSAKRAAADDQVRDEKQVKQTSAPIKNRQLRPYAPGGVEELKKQFQQIH